MLVDLYHAATGGFYATAYQGGLPISGVCLGEFFPYSKVAVVQLMAGHGLIKADLHAGKTADIKYRSWVL